MDLFSLQQRRQRGDVVAVYNYLIRGYRENGAKLFLEVHSGKTRYKEHKLEHEKF